MTAEVPTVTIHEEDGTYRYRLNYPDGSAPFWGEREISRTGAVWGARSCLRVKHGTVAETTAETLAAVAQLAADHLVFPEQAGSLAQKLDRLGLLVGGFPRQDITPTAEVAQIVRWRNLATPQGCYSEFDYVRAADALAGELEAAGLLASLPGPAYA